MDAFAEHWPDILLAALLAVVGWLLRRDINRADDTTKELGKEVGDHEVRISVIEDREGIPRR